ncbi:hypothetical protein CGLO_17026 [Colletotrichum gloeosporioides Cg-14]|uniref:Uncharacterized protein n=1 Tax=Colletotrichum gloeosporioides (strain Cg-14) TaxID=1237896 RepID=T0JUL0_COLGC|nr:hypothetical protein CGLO_17026 [Colletotrichum gloeosporioides Cg-14]
MNTPNNSKPALDGKNKSTQPAQKQLSAVEELLSMYDGSFDRVCTQNSDFLTALLAARQEAHERARETEGLAKKTREHAEMMDKLVKQYESSS